MRMTEVSEDFYLSALGAADTIATLRKQKEEYEEKINNMQALIDCLKAELVGIQSNNLELPYEPIEVATILIRATTMVKTTPVYRVFNPNASDEHETGMYSKKIEGNCGAFVGILQ